MNVGLLTLLLFGSAMILLILGIPIAIAIGGIGVIFALKFWGYDHLYILASAAYSNLLDLNLIAIPLFVFMGAMMNVSGMAEDLFKTIRSWLGGVRGGLMVGTLIIAGLWAAMSGELVAAVYVVSTVALMPMLNFGNDRRLVVGTITAGATLVVMIPPSIDAIIFASVTGLSVGRVYTAMWGPGVLLLVLYIIYIIVICRLRPSLAPVIPKEKRAKLNEKFSTLKGSIWPIILLLAIIGGIYSGAITAMEAATIGAVGSFIISVARRRINLQNFREAAINTLKVSGMIALFLMAVGCFSTVYSGIGALNLAADIAKSVPGGGIVAIIIMMVALLIAGCFLDDFAIIMIFGPIFMKVVQAIGYDPIWFAALFMVTMQTAFLSPPYGFSLFIMRSAVPKDLKIDMTEIIRSVVPFISLQLVCLAATLFYQPLSLFLPHLLFK